jgi:hypothetical protein
VLSMMETVRNAYCFGDLWVNALQVRYKPTRRVFPGRALEPYRTANYVPCCLFVEDLTEKYPNAKICGHYMQSEKLPSIPTHRSYKAFAKVLKLGGNLTSKPLAFPRTISFTSSPSYVPKSDDTGISTLSGRNRIGCIMEILLLR